MCTESRHDYLLLLYVSVILWMTCCFYEISCSIIYKCFIVLFSFEKKREYEWNIIVNINNYNINYCSEMTKKSHKTTRLKYAIQKLENEHQINMFKLVMEKDSVNFEKKCFVFLSLILIIIMIVIMILLYINYNK